MGAGGSKLRKLVGGSSVYAHRHLERSVLGPRGYFPICVGVNEENSMRFMIHTKALKDADFCELLRKSAEEYGFQNDGILRILFEAQGFEDWIIKRQKRKKIIMVTSRRSYLLKRSNKEKRKKDLCNLNHRGLEMRRKKC